MRSSRCSGEHSSEPQSENPIIVRINSTGSNDVYLTDLTLNGFEEYDGEVPTAINNVFCTTGGVIFYGDIASIAVYDTDGRVVAQSAMSQFCNLASLPAGLYVAKAMTKDGQTLTTKVIRK